jgi:hypothetical protein
MNKSVSRAGLRFHFVFPFSLFSLFPFQPRRSRVFSRLILSVTIFCAAWFLLFLCVLFLFPGVLNYGTLGKVRGVCYGVVGGLDIVENHGLHGVGPGHFMIDITITHYFQLDELISIATI